MRFASLGSGSRGNATLVECRATTLMIDNGFTLKDTERRLARLGKSPLDISLILVTHEHGDHIRGVGSFARKYSIPVMMTSGTERSGRLLGREGCRVQLLEPQLPIHWRDIHISPVLVPHDAKEPVQFIFSDGNKKLGMLTDLGSLTAHVLNAYTSCDALILETNHDPSLLAVGPYPHSVKMRVGGNYGHLSNQQAADLLQKIDCSRLQHLVASHISEQNNCKKLAAEALAAALNCSTSWIQIAHQETGFDWREVL